MTTKIAKLIRIGSFPSSDPKIPMKRPPRMTSDGVYVCVSMFRSEYAGLELDADAVADVAGLRLLGGPADPVLLLPPPEAPQASRSRRRGSIAFIPFVKTIFYFAQHQSELVSAYKWTYLLAVALTRCPRKHRRRTV